MGFGIRNGVVYLILYHCIKHDIARSEVGEKLSFENVINILDKAIHRFITPEDFHGLINFQDQSGNTLLHQAVINNKTKAITTLLKYGANPLIKNANGKIPLDLAKEEVIDPTTGEKTREVLIESMEKQANSKKWSAVHNSSFGIIPGVFLGVGLGVSGALAGPSMAIMLGTAAAFALVVGIAAGLTIYFLSQDHEQAKAIESVISASSELSSVNEVTPVEAKNGQQPT